MNRRDFIKKSLITGTVVAAGAATGGYIFIDKTADGKFMESYDFSGKQVVPFATSGGSGMGNSGSIMQKLAPKAKVDSGKRFSSGVSEKDLKDWAVKFF